MKTDDSLEDPSTLPEVISQLQELRGLRLKELFPVLFVTILCWYASLLTDSGGGRFFLPAITIMFMTMAVMDMKERKRTDALIQALRHLNRKN